MPKYSCGTRSVAVSTVRKCKETIVRLQDRFLDETDELYQDLKAVENILDAMVDNLSPDDI